MTLIEVAIYAMVLSGPMPGLCRLDEGAVVTCSNGLSAQVLSDAEARFSSGVTVRHAGDQFPAFSNGISSRIDAAGWLVFSNGVAVRRRSLSRYDFADGIMCRAELPELVGCSRLP